VRLHEGRTRFQYLNTKSPIMKKLLENRNLSGWLMVSPLAVVLLFFLVMPIFLIVIVSFWRATEFSIIPAFEFDNY
jgi:putative spermidine/putrescine transport system permease protein